jgi:predicted DsbA family dithiol-disulfide isomerase
MRAELFANPQTLAQTSVHAQAVGLDQASFDACLAAGKLADDIHRDVAQAQAAGIDGTPGFLLATTDGRGQLKVRRMLLGAQPFATFKAEIDALLAGR